MSRLANLDRVLGALEIARSGDGLGISPRRITISTVGLPPAIDRLASQQGAVQLGGQFARSQRSNCGANLVPVNKKIGVDAILDAADRYFDSSGRRLTFEYVLLGGVNDSEDEAQAARETTEGPNRDAERDSLQPGRRSALRNARQEIDRRFSTRRLKRAE